MSFKAYLKEYDRARTAKNVLAFYTVISDKNTDLFRSFMRYHRIVQGGKNVKKQFIEAGKIVGTHGLKGEMRVEVWCDSPQFLCKFKRLYFGKGSTELKVITARPHKNIVILLVDGVNTVEQADTMRGRIIYINRSDMKLDKNVFLIQDILGIDVRDIDTGKSYGKVTDVFKTGANDVYQVTDENKKDYLIPVIDDVVKEINTDDEYILIKPMKGIFDDED